MMRLGEGWENNEVVVRFDVLPRGSGNRNFCRKLADAFPEHAIIGPFIHKVVAGASSVTVHFEASLACMKAINEVCEEGKAAKDAPGQLGLFEKMGAALG